MLEPSVVEDEERRSKATLTLNPLRILEFWRSNSCDQARSQSGADLEAQAARQQWVGLSAAVTHPSPGVNKSTAIRLGLVIPIVGRAWTLRSCLP
jgi:hypothetical protein